jgi:hypothetical protein
VEKEEVREDLFEEMIHNLKEAIMARKKAVEEQISVNGPPIQRYRIMSDDSGHEYAIKVEDEDAFYAWVAATESEDIEDAAGYYEGPVFDDNRIDGRFTFTDPRNE